MGERSERPERVFPGRTDPWFIAAMVIVAGGLSAACIACFLSSSPALLWGWLALLPVPALVALAALPVRSNRLELYGDRLVVVYAGMRSVIPYAHVRGVRRTRTLWAGTANSLDRVYIKAPYDGDAIVSVTDNDALMAELERRCGLRPDCEQGNLLRRAAISDLLLIVISRRPILGRAGGACRGRQIRRRPHRLRHRTVH